MITQQLPALTDLTAISNNDVNQLWDVCLNPTALAIAARVLDLKWYEHLDQGSLSITRLADLTGAGSTEAQILLSLGSAFQLLEGNAEGVRPGSLAKRFLLSTSKMRLAGLVQRHQMYLDGMKVLQESIRKVPAARPRMLTAASTPSEQEEYFSKVQAFRVASLDYYVETASLLARAHARMPLDTCHRVLDVGSGPAAFAAIVAKAFPNIEVHAVDMVFRDPKYRDAVESWLSRQGVKVACLGTNFLTEAIDVRPDLITANRFFSGIPREAASEWIDRFLANLAPGGRIALVDYMTSGEPHHDAKVAQLYGFWFSWNYYEITTRPPTSDTDQRAQWGFLAPWSASELSQLLRGRGFKDVKVVECDAPFLLVSATR